MVITDRVAMMSSSGSVRYYSRHENLPVKIRSINSFTRAGNLEVVRGAGRETRVSKNNPGGLKV